VGRRDFFKRPERLRVRNRPCKGRDVRKGSIAARIAQQGGLAAVGGRKEVCVPDGRRDRVARGYGRHAAAPKQPGKCGLGCAVRLATARFAIGEGAEESTRRLGRVQGTALARASGLQKPGADQVRGQLAVGLNVAPGKRSPGLGQRCAVHRGRQPQVLAGQAGQAVAQLRLQDGQAPLSQRQIRGPASARAAHERGAHQVLVACALDISRSLAQGASK